MKRKSILVIEDNEETLQLLEFALNKMNHDVITAKNGLEALEILKNQTPDAIISDIIMPDMDGYTLIRKIKNNPKMKNVPLIVSSCKSGMKEYFKYEDDIYKPDAYLEKPYQMKFFIETIKKVLK